MATVAAAEAESKTYWCHECDMSVSLTSSQSHSSSPLLCPHCNTHFLELMDYSQNDAAQPPQQFHSLFDSPFLHRLISTTTTTSQNDAVLEDPLSLLSPTTLTSNPKPRAADTLQAIPVTHSLLSRLDPNGVVLCAVCKDEIGVDDEGKLLPCNHLYHSDCITPWLAHHDSCPLCRFRVTAAEEEDEEGGGDASRTGEIRRQLRAAMVRLSELMEEEEDDFYGLRITLNHIASRHGLLHQDSNGSRVSESATLGAGDEQLPR